MWTFASFQIFRVFMQEEPPYRLGGANMTPVVEKEDYIGMCSDDTLESEVGVFLVDELGGHINGLFDPNIPLIALVATSTNVITHEVSHLVDYIVTDKGIRDGETRAYLQGHFTECIEELIEWHYAYKEKGYNVIHISR